MNATPMIIITVIPAKIRNASLYNSSRIDPAFVSRALRLGVFSTKHLVNKWYSDVRTEKKTT